jgi:hypothetical protein
VSTRFALLDSLSLAGDSAKPNEDSFAASPRMAAVFDGATGLGASLMPGKSDAYWLAQFSARRLKSHAETDSGGPRDWLAATAAEAEKSFLALRLRAPAQRYEIPFASMMMLALDGETLRALYLGDCAALVESAQGLVLVGETLAKRGREAARAAALAKSTGENAAGACVREIFLPALREARNRVNKTNGDWLFAPDTACSSHADEAVLRVRPGARVLIASDGFLALIADYGAHTPESLMDAAASRGLAALGSDLRAIEGRDADGVAYPRFKRSDDATALLLRVVADADMTKAA